MAQRNVDLRSLRAHYVEADHGLYVSLLATDILGESGSRNIAVSGAYGSGKSSVLEGLLSALDARKVKAIQVSLATLNQSRESLLEVSGEATLTGALEKEVVKRLLYSARPSQIPLSRFNRISGFRPWPAAGLAAVIGALVTGVAMAFGVALPMDQLVAVQGWWSWTAPLLDILLLSLLAFVAQAALSSFRFTQISVGPATLSLDDKDGNYFDHFLDEIIYFFQRTKIRVVLFEDLDRFNDPGIFLGLRELNNLLNASQQIEGRITFVYAIRDSLFVRAIASVDGVPQASNLPDEHARHGAESAASDRAKFFDLIIPIVPFISHEVAADLLVRALDDLPSRLAPSRPLVSLAGRHFTDMRVILSIRNEYGVFASELLEKSAVQGLAPDQLFAMVIYKHVHLDDFERIRTGESRLDLAIDSLRRFVRESVTAADGAIAELEDVIESESGADRRAKAAGERLLALLDVVLRHRGWAPVQTVTVAGSTGFERAAVASPSFWRTVAEAESTSLQVQTANGRWDVPEADVDVMLGSDRHPKAWIRVLGQRDRQRLTALRQAREWLIAASFSELITGPFPSASLGDTHSWMGAADVCREALGPGLPFELMRYGYLDQDFALYTTKFHGTIVSAAARSYLMQYVDRHRSEPLFLLSGEDVDQIVSRRGDSLLSDPSGLNVSIVDRLLETEAARLPTQLLAAGQATEFLLTYVANGHHSDELLRRIAGARGDILDVISSASGLSEAERRHALSICLSSISGDIDYSVSHATADFLAGNVSEMPVLGQQVPSAVASAIAELLAANGLRLYDLSLAVEPLRSSIAAAGSFEISRANLEVLSQRPGVVGLDSLGGAEGGVGRYLIANMADYLAAVSESPTASVIDDSDSLDALVRAIVDNDPSDLTSALALLPGGAAYENLATAPDVAYADLARAGAFQVTRSNVSEYVATVGAIDAAMAARLMESRSIEVGEEPPDEVEESARQTLATEIVLCDELDRSAKVELVVSLETATTLVVGRLDLVDPVLAVDLLAAGEIADALETFRVLAEGPWPVFEACAAKSTRFDSYASDLSFTEDLLTEMLGSEEISEEVKRALLGRFDEFAPSLGVSSASAWIVTASRLRLPLTAGQLITLASKGARSELVLEFVKHGHAGWPGTDLASVLAQCEEPYSSLATANGVILSVPFAEDFRPVLQSLKDAGVVKDFHKKRMRDQFEVRMAG